MKACYDPFSTFSTNQIQAQETDLGKEELGKA